MSGDKTTTEPPKQLPEQTSQPEQINVPSLKHELNLAFQDLNFEFDKFDDARKATFFTLSHQYIELEGAHVAQKCLTQSIKLTQNEIIEYIAIAFVQIYGERLWPTEDHCHPKLSLSRFVFERDQILRTPLGRTLEKQRRDSYQMQVRSKLGRVVKNYFEAVKKIPASEHPEPEQLGPPTMQEVERLLEKFLNSSQS